MQKPNIPNDSVLLEHTASSGRWIRNFGISESGEEETLATLRTIVANSEMVGLAYNCLVVDGRGIYSYRICDLLQ